MFSFLKKKNILQNSINPNIDNDIFMGINFSMTGIKDEERYIQSLPKGAQIVWSTLDAEAEVQNGGFNQYFWNSKGFEVDLALEGYKQLAAKKLATVLQEAMNFYMREFPKFKQLHGTNTKEAFVASYELINLENYDKQFYKALEKENPSSLRANFIQKHPKDFKEYIK